MSDTVSPTSASSQRPCSRLKHAFLLVSCHPVSPLGLQPGRAGTTSLCSRLVPIAWHSARCAKMHNTCWMSARPTSHVGGMMEKHLTSAKCPVFTLLVPAHQWLHSILSPPYTSGTIITPITQKKNIKFLPLRSHVPSPTVHRCHRQEPSQAVCAPLHQGHSVVGSSLAEPQPSRSLPAPQPRPGTNSVFTAATPRNWTFVKDTHLTDEETEV